MKVLVAEDSRSMRAVVRGHLRRWGYEAVCVENGAQALAALREDHLSLVLVDWLMPEMDGLELCRRVRASEWDRYIYLLMLTSMADKENLAEAIDAGADDYIAKPFEELELSARLQAACRFVELERRLARQEQELAARVAELEESLRTIKQLKELLPICMCCKKIRDDNDYWQQVEDYLHENTGSDFSHGICPECYETVVKAELRELQEQKEAAQ